MYLATVFYHKDNIMVTAEDQIPLVEIQCCSTSIIHDLPWFAKASFTAVTFYYSQALHIKPSRMKLVNGDIF